MWSLAAMEKSARVELFFCAPTAETNQTRFVAMLAHKDEIEKNFGEPLLWDFKDGRKQQYLRLKFLEYLYNPFVGGKCRRYSLFSNPQSAFRNLQSVMSLNDSSIHNNRLAGDVV